VILDHYYCYGDLSDRREGSFKEAKLKSNYL